MTHLPNSRLYAGVRPSFWLSQLQYSIASSQLTLATGLLSAASETCTSAPESWLARNSANSLFVTSWTLMKKARVIVTGTMTSLARRPTSAREAPIENVAGSTRRSVWPAGDSSVFAMRASAMAASDRRVAVNVCGYPGRGVTVRFQLS